jgi:NAD(P)-dependent dehydrogenase (short-subunit alcohol dehydrogenase family)
MTSNHKTALVTGANSGVGFEAAAQLAEQGWGRVILACRSVQKAEIARKELVARTNKDPFAVLAVDTSETGSALAAADELLREGQQIDFLLLNAGASGKEPTFNSSGIETTYASTLIGHHVLTMRLLSDGMLAPGARIVIAGSEGSRGNLPGMTLHDIRAIADSRYSGDLSRTIQELVHVKLPEQARFTNMHEYVTAKLLVAWWAAAVSRRLPAGMTVNAVSPGSVLETNFTRNAPTAMKLFMLPMMRIVGPLMGMAGPVKAAAARYLQAADFPDDSSGQFYATAHRKKLAGSMGLQTWPDYFRDERGQEATFEALEALTQRPG